MTCGWLDAISHGVTLAVPSLVCIHVARTTRVLALALELLAVVVV